MTVLQQPLAVRGLPPAASLPLGVALAALLRFPLGPSNPVTPAGYVGYVKRGALFGRERFVALQTGPTSSGRGWLLRVINVSVTPYTYDEEFSGSETVLSCDSLKIAFGVHLVWRVRPERLRRFVENFSHPGGATTAPLPSSRWPIATSCASRCAPRPAMRCRNTAGSS